MLFIIIYSYHFTQFNISYKEQKFFFFFKWVYDLVITTFWSTLILLKVYYFQLLSSFTLLSSKPHGFCPKVIQKYILIHDESRIQNVGRTLGQTARNYYLAAHF